MSSQLADATGRPDRVANMHFFNPALVMRCVEVVRGPETSDATVDAVVALTRELGKEPVVLRKEIPGFVANRILGAVRDEAIFLLENGISSVEDIDTARADLIGRGVDVGEVQEAKPPGFDSPGRSYFARASFSDPDGNSWELQEITERLPGRTWED